MGTSTLTVLNQRLCPCWLMLYSLWTLTLCHLSDLSDLSDLPLESAYADSNTWDWASGGVQFPLILEAPARLPGSFRHLCCWSSPRSLDRFCLQCWPCSNFSQPPDLTLCSALSLLNRWPAGQPPELLLYLALCLGQLIDQFQCLASWSGQPPELSSMFPYSDALFCFVPSALPSTLTGQVGVLNFGVGVRVVEWLSLGIFNSCFILYSLFGYLYSDELKLQ